MGLLSSDWFRAILAALPIVLVFLLIGLRKAPVHLAALVGAGLALVLALFVWEAPWDETIFACLYGVLIGLFPIIYLIAGSLLLYNLTQVTGWAERLRRTLEQAVPDRYLLLLLVGFGFAAFLDSTAGFLAPVTVATAVLVGLGVPALEAASYTLVASSLPPVFGAMGIPVVVLAEVSGVPLVPLAHLQAVTAALLFAGFPAWLTLAFGGWASLQRLWAPALAGGIAYALVLLWMVTQFSFYPAGLAASVAALAAILLTARLFSGRMAHIGMQMQPITWRKLFPWWPYGLLMLLVLTWSVPAINRLLDRLTVLFSLPRLPGPAVWRFNWLSSPGTAILLSALLFAAFSGATPEKAWVALKITARQIRYVVVSMLAMLAMAQLMNFSGMTASLGEAVAGAGLLFPLISPLLSWLGAAIAGSNTAANAILGNLQATTAAQLGLEPLFIVGLAGVAAPLGKMVAPQVISAAAGAGGLSNAETKLLRTGLFHSLIWTGIIAVAGWLLLLVRGDLIPGP